MAHIQGDDPSRPEKNIDYHLGDIEKPLTPKNWDNKESDPTKSPFDNNIVLADHENKVNPPESDEQDKTNSFNNKMWREKIRVREREEKKKKILQVMVG